MRQILTGVLASVLVAALAFTDVATSAGAAAAAAPSPSITLNGTVTEGDPGALTSKSIILATGNEVKVNYRLVPNYSAGQASGVRVTLFMPSLEHVDGEYQVVARDAAPTPLGVQGRVSSGGEWNVISDTTVKGGPLVLEYDGDLRGGANPAFDIFLTTYNDGTNGVYGGIPEGTPFEINGFVSYDMFDRAEGSEWETPGQLDDESRVAIISSDLKWETKIEPYAYGNGDTSVPMWDRYQYFDYVYTVDNVSTNPGSNIEGYTGTFDIDTTDNINGIIPFDINRFSYTADGKTEPNTDPEATEGEFIGVPGKGGVLIYDITEWDGESELTEEIPYSYSGAGMISINREHGAAKQGLKPGEKHKFMVSLPMSRQGFPNLPTNFKLTAITNVLFAKTANWTKTHTAVREVDVPRYGLTFTHAPEKATVEESQRTYTEISAIKNTSNAPIFNTDLSYTIDPGFVADSVTLEFPTEKSDPDLSKSTLTYTYTDKKGAEQTGTLTGTLGESEQGADHSKLTFDVSKLYALDWNRELSFSFVSGRLNPGKTLPLTIRVYGTAPTAGTITDPAAVTYNERYASNDDYAEDTVYTDVPHTVQRDAVFTVVKPKPQDVLKPVVDVIGVYGNARTKSTTQVPYEAPFQAEYQLSTGGVPAASFEYTMDLSAPTVAPGVAKPTKIALTDALLGSATDLELAFIDAAGKKVTTADTTVTLGDLALTDVAKIVISGKMLTLASAETIAVVDYSSALAMGGSQTLQASFAGRQVPPDTATRTASKTNVVTVPEAKTTVKIEGLNQVTKSTGAGNSYDQWVDRQWYCSTSGCGSKTDYTLDQGYKSLGGFAASITRPTTAATNNDQTTVVSTKLPAEQFDMYYMKIRSDLQPYLRSVDIFRTIDGKEVLWKTVPAADWTANTTEGKFWRIATADPRATDLSETFATVDAEGHTYYKAPFAADVVPDQPVSRVAFTLDFSRADANALPELKGTTSRVVEFMGRFYATTTDTKKPTSVTAADTFGTTAATLRTHVANPVYSIVSHPFAKSSTGAQDSTSTASKTVTMGTEANYLASVWNVNTASWYIYNGHGPDVYTPVATEFDEWLYHYNPESFHDRLTYEFTYPASPKDDKEYNFEATQITLPNVKLLNSLTELRVTFGNQKTATLTVDDDLRKEILAQPQLKLVYDNSQPAGIHRVNDTTFAISAGVTATYPKTFEASFEKIAGIGDTTAELQGGAGDSLGADLKEIDVKVGGVVNGNKALVGTTALYRESNGTARTKMDETKATLLGATPTLGGTLDMTFDALSVYDYETDGITPTTSTVHMGMANSAQADVTSFTMNIVPDASFRSQQLEIPAAIFDADWRTASVKITQPSGKPVEIPLDRFSLNPDTHRYELDLVALFEAQGDEAALLTMKTVPVTFGGKSDLLQLAISNISIDFAAATDETRMWGSFARETDPTLSARMIDGSYAFLTGIWVDETAAGHDWNSKPSFRAEGTKLDAGNYAYTSFRVHVTDMKSPQRFTVNAGGSNSGMTPTLSKTTSAAPVLHNRVSSLQLLGMHLNDDLSQATGSANYLFDADTDGPIAANNMVVGDTAKVLYELRNASTAGNGSTPVADPAAHFTAPQGLDIAEVTVVQPGDSETLDGVIAAAGRTPVNVAADQFTVTDKTAKKRTDVTFSGVTVAAQESVFVLVKYVAVNDYAKDPAKELGATQKQTVYPYSYARPGYQHHLQNYVVTGVTGDGITGNSSVTGDYDGDKTNEYLARTYGMTTYANPTGLTLKSAFTEESLSGTGMMLSLSKISNKIVHSNTNATLDITLDSRARGFTLTELPTPTYPEGFVGEFDAPQVLIRVNGQWVAYDKNEHSLAGINELRVDYGILPARDEAGAEFQLPDFTITGTGHWQATGGAATKSSVIASSAVLTLTHHDGAQPENPAVASYAVTATDQQTIYKAIPVVELNLQSFDTADEAAAEYTDVSAAQLGKTSYLPGDDVHLKLTARNADTPAATNTGFGKAPLLEPIMYDKIPEYITSDLDAFITGGTLDAAAAIAAGKLTINRYDRAGKLISGADLPAVTVETVTGLDVGGSQTFANNRHNDTYGLLSSTEPNDASGLTAKNPAAKIDFQLVTYTFPTKLGRGERIEIMYAGTIRENDLPVATYKDGHAVFAPLMSWYSGNTPVASNMHQTNMDMAALLHDAGITGTRSDEMTATEFLSTSFAWQPGSNTERRHPASSSGTLDTYYDSSANSSMSHKAFMQERVATTYTNPLYEAATGGEADDNFAYVGVSRVNDGSVRHGERVLWAQDNLQLNRAWLYGASEMLPDVQRKASGVDAANFYEFDGSLRKPDNNITEYAYDDYTYAVELHEQLTVRLHAANLGDRSIESGIEYLEVLPEGISPYDGHGELLGVTAYDGTGSAIDADRVTVDVVQSPRRDHGYRAPAQQQEAGSYAETTRDEVVPYVVRVQVTGELGGMFNASTSTMQSKYQYVDLRVRVEHESSQLVDGKFTWYDQLTVTTVDEEPYLEVYDSSYGGYHRAPDIWNPLKFPNDGMQQGIDVVDLLWSNYSYSTYLALEPWGMYISGINSQGTTTELDGKPAIVNGDRLAMRAPTLRVWNNTEKDADSATGGASSFDKTLQNFTAELYEEFTVHSTVENQQVETDPAYFTSGYTEDKWKHQPQTTGGARGTWFDPTVTVSLPYGIVPMLADGQPARYTGKVDDQQDIVFTAAINDVTYKSSTQVADVSEHLTVKVERVASNEGERFVLHFTAKRTAAAQAALHAVKFGQSLTVSPRVKTIDGPAPAAADDASPEVASADDTKYQQILTLAHSERPSFKPVVVAAKPTGSVPTGAPADRDRLDSTSEWLHTPTNGKANNLGVIKITERLISATKTFLQNDKISLHSGGSWDVEAARLIPVEVPTSEVNAGAYGGTRMVLRRPTIVNSTKTGLTKDGEFVETQLVDAAGDFWLSQEITNRAATSENPYEMITGSGDVHNSRFVLSAYVSAFAERIGDPMLVVDDKVLAPAEYEKLGYAVKMLTSDERAAAGNNDRQLIQWRVTTPPNAIGTSGKLASGASITVRHKLRLVDGYEDTTPNEEPTWHGDALKIDSYVSLITDDTSLIAGDQREGDFIVQNAASMTYETRVAEHEGLVDYDNDDKLETTFAHNPARIEIIKPRGEVRVNTTRPRLEYSNGRTGDPYFNSSDTIEYIVTHAKNTGSGLKEFAFEHTLPTNESNDPTNSLSTEPVNNTLLYVSTGLWEIPAETTELLAEAGKSIDDVFETEVLVSNELAEAGYEAGTWKSLGTSSIRANTEFKVPAADRLGKRKIRVIVRSLDPDFLVPKGTRLAIDADPATDGSQEVTETDPENQSITEYPTSVTDNAMRIGLRAASERKATIFIYDTVQMWGNYVANARLQLDNSEARAYLTPSRPVVNVYHDATYYRSDSTKPTEERYGWSENTAIKPDVSPHLKFRGEIVNADESMWNPDTEGNTYAEDTLINPTVSFELPSVMTVGDDFTYVPNDQITASHPLSDDHRSRYGLTDNDAYLWTWKLVHADGTEASADSHIKHTKIHTGSWPGMDRNVVTVWFDGTVFPGDKVVVDFIGKIDAYTPGAKSDDLKSKVYVTNSTGLVQPLNSAQNSGNRLGYMTDRYDLDANKLFNERLVFAERVLFEYETYDNFGKRKVAYSDLNRAGTVWPQSTPVREGGTLTYELAMDNTKEPGGSTAYPYPIMYDVLPFAGDTSIMNAATSRESMGSSELDLTSMTLRREGDGGGVYPVSEYTVYVGPFKMQGGKVVAADMLESTTVGTEAFYDSLGVPGAASAVRDAHFVTLAQFTAAVAADPALLGEAQTLLTLFNTKDASLPGQSKLKLSYDMRSPLNAPAYIETWQPEAKPADVGQWNSFVGTQRKTGFKPQESNKAGTYVTERKASVSIGNYVWHDVNYNAKQDEGTIITDDNGRELLQPSKDINFDGTVDDPGINGVKVTLLSPNGRLVDYAGNSVARQGGEWTVVNDETGKVITDDLGQTTPSDGPLVTTTRSDIHGNAGYYVFSNITPGSYRVMFEFPAAYDRFSVTTKELISGAGVTVYEPGFAASIPAANAKEALVAITSAQEITTESVDKIRMGFDLGVGQLADFGGVIWNDANRNGVRDAGEQGLAGYRVALKDGSGKPVRDARGDALETVSAADGSYLFTALPRGGNYTIQATHPGGTYDVEMPVTPILLTHDPLAQTDDNDGFLRKSDSGARQVVTNTFSFDLERLFGADFAAINAINVGFTERQDTAVIGNRVWNDLNRDGIQDADEPGIAGQQLELEQYVRAGDEWVKQDGFTRITVSGADGYYYFADVPAFSGEDTDPIEYRYQVVVRELTRGFTFAPTQTGNDAEADSDFFLNGTMHEGAVGANLISLLDMEGGSALAVDTSSVDLGLIAHATGVIAGEVFIDADADGTKTGDDRATERYTATLQVSVDGETWTDVTSQHGVNAYRFEGLAIHHEDRGVLNQYRVVITEIPLWLQLTAQNAGTGDGADAIDSDFAETVRDGAATVTAVSDVYVLGELAEGHLLPVDTREAITHEDVDLGLIEPAITIGGRVWNDANADGIQDADEADQGGNTVTLWERVDGEWRHATDRNGVMNVTVGTDGRYRFTVSPTVYDEADPRFLQPREYRVSTDRLGYQEWSPVHIGDDRALDSDIAFDEAMDGAEGGSLHRGFTDAFSIVDTDGASGAIVANTVRDDLTKDIGLVTNAHLATIGGVVWNDANQDGARQASEGMMADQELTLWERIDEEWVVVEDRNGNSTRVSGVDGSYEFVVSPTDYAEISAGYLLPREYRVTTTVPAGYELSQGAEVTASFDGEKVVTLTAQIVTVGEDGRILVREVTNDLSLDFPFVFVPVVLPSEPDGIGGLVNTGGGPLVFWGAAAAIALLGGGALVLWSRRKRPRHAAR
nr:MULTISPECIES: SdrD B-like domain-containing protein [unclassified Leucobacter]